MTAVTAKSNTFEAIHFLDEIHKAHESFGPDVHMPKSHSKDFK